MPQTGSALQRAGGMGTGRIGGRDEAPSTKLTQHRRKPLTTVSSRPLRSCLDCSCRSYRNLGEEENRRFSQDSPPASIPLTFFLNYLLYKLPMLTVQKLEKVEKRKDREDVFPKKLMILLLTDQTTISMLVSLTDSFFYSRTAHKYFMGPSTYCFVTCFLHLTEHRKHLSLSANIQ